MLELNYGPVHRVPAVRRPRPTVCSTISRQKHVGRGMRSHPKQMGRGIGIRQSLGHTAAEQ